MEFELERLYRILKDLKGYSIKKRVAVKNYKTLNGHEKGKQREDTSSWETYETGELWGGYDQHRWFKTTITIPNELDKEHIVFHLNTGNPEGWDISNPQFLIYIDEKATQGLDVNHRNTLLSTCAREGDEYDIALLGYSGLNEGKVFIQSELQAVDVEIEAFYYDLNNLFITACILDKDDYNRKALLASLNQAVDALDMRRVYSEAFYTSLRQQQQIIKEKYYTDINGAGPVVTSIGHTHIDIAWLWTIDQTREKVIRSFSTVLYLMDLYPDYMFMSSQPLLYQFLKEEAPEIYERVKEKVKEGRWEVDGAMWVESDCNIPSGESLVRQILFGTRFIETEFDKKCETLWLPDVFGYSSALPQLLQKSGVKYFFTTKLDWNQTNKLPHDTFIWEGLDGSEVLTHLVTTSSHMQYRGDVKGVRSQGRESTYNGRMEPNQVMGTWTNYKDKYLTDETFQVFGFGDGGGGPTEPQLQNAKRLKYGIPGIPRVAMDHQKNYFGRLKEKVDEQKMPAKWVGELYFENHRGTYTSMAKNKRFNRRAEVLMHNLEFLATLNMTFGASYPTAFFERNWKMILKNQFHDIIPGSAIEKVYDQTDLEYATFFEEGNALLNQEMAMIADWVNVEADSIIVVNALSHERNDVIAIDTDALESKVLIDNDGNKLVGQLTQDGDKCLFYLEHLPAKGYKTFTLGKDDEISSEGNNLEALTNQLMSDHNIETYYYKIKFDKDFHICSIWDKKAEREIITAGEKANVFELYEDRPMDFENWNIDEYHELKKYIVDGLSSVEITEHGAIRSCISISRKVLESTIVQKIYLYHKSPKIEFKTQVEWHEHQVLMKVAFPVDIHSNRASYETQYGNLERNTHANTSWDRAQFEVCAQRWIDYSEGEYGVSLLNDCKYGHSVKDGVMRMTLIKCGQYPNPNADQGLHEFIYTLLPHVGGWQEGRTYQYASELNNALLWHKKKVTSTHGAMGIESDQRPLSLSMITIDKDNCIIEVVKKAEDSEGILVRIYECMNRRTKAKVSLFAEVEEVVACDLLEHPLEKISSEGHSFEVEIKPYEIQTYLIR